MAPTPSFFLLLRLKERLVSPVASLVAAQRLTAILAISALASTASCSGSQVHQESYIVSLDTRSFDELVSAVEKHSAKTGDRVTTNLVQGAGSKTRLDQVMIEGRGVRTIVQSALAEKCVGREGRRDVEYSQSVLEVESFSTTLFVGAKELAAIVVEQKAALEQSGFRIVTHGESCALLDSEAAAR